VPGRLALLWLALSCAATAQTSEYFVTAGDQSRISVLQGHARVRSWTDARSVEYPIIVLNDEVRTSGRYISEQGSIYDLSGALLGGPLAFDVTAYPLDATTDGNSIFFVDRRTGPVYRCDLDYRNCQLIFDPGRPVLGITYDPTDDTLWTSDWTSRGMVSHYTLAGALLGEWPTGRATGSGALALDHADGTLWLNDSNNRTTFEQWTKSGTLLWRGTMAGMSPDNVLGGEFLFQIGAVVRVVDAAPASVAQGQSGAVVSFTAENIARNTVDVTATDLVFLDGGGVDLSSEYTVTPDPANPTTIASGATETFAFTVDVDAMATRGTITIHGLVTSQDQVTMASFTDRVADTPDTWEVAGALPFLRTSDATPATVARGSSGHAVSVTVENAGLNPLGVILLELRFADGGGGDVTPDYAVVADPVNPASIAPGATESFAFSVDVDPTATLGTVTIDAHIDAQDLVSMTNESDTGADVPDSWDVVTCAATVCGDCNGDGVVSILDALTAAQHSAALIVLVGVDFTNCNVTGAVEPDPAAAVTILDALSLAQSAAGLPVALVCC
jgi:hypothetical protein